MKKLLIILSLLTLFACGDKEEDKTETHTVTFKNNSHTQEVTIWDNTGSVTPLFGSFTIKQRESKTIEYSCEDCPEFSFTYERRSIGGWINWILCVCDDGSSIYSFGYCPGYDFTSPQIEGFADGKCLKCSQPSPCGDLDDPD
jgi:hypothetical protein